jgi:hypothetical protein
MDVQGSVRPRYCNKASVKWNIYIAYRVACETPFYRFRGGIICL